MKTRLAFSLLTALSLAAFGCGSSDSSDSDSSRPDPSSTPRWAQEAVWYQIFVERFRNGDSSNDPTAGDIQGAWPEMEIEGWQPTPWGQDWYKQEDWARQAGLDFYTSVQLRRYGGDLQGVLDKLDYLQDLGVTALYFNPLNDSPSLHKYDARSYRHIDRNFGPDPRADEAIAQAENPADPSTWRWTAADSLFLKLIEEVHRRGMRLIMDYSFNHTGVTFWAFRDVVEKQQQSPYADWYEIESFDDPATEENEFQYQGWVGVKQLPAFRKYDLREGPNHGFPRQGDLHPQVKAHIFAVVKRWLDPNGDGDPSDGVDGFRLDVAEQVPMGFWRDFRRHVRDLNPQAYLVGEIWWEEWPDLLMDPYPWLQGDVFDGVMNYRWYVSARGFLAGGQPIPAGGARGFQAELSNQQNRIAPERLKAQMNVAATHDTPRLSTSLYNRGKYKFQVNPRENADYKLERPDQSTGDRVKMLLLLQFAWIGAPHIWNGDEMGMWGADDPDCRKPLVWEDVEFEEESAHPAGGSKRRDRVEVDEELRDFIKKLIDVRKSDPELFVDGEVKWVVYDGPYAVIRRSRPGRTAVALFNTGSQVLKLNLPFERSGGALVDPFSGQRYPIETQNMRIELPPGSGTLLVEETEED